uniref:Uncharacterized protein n=1 Tax=Anguilla anguilla TaxID=7936 RepID=A0A0E9XRE7_ANGAN
MATRLLCHWPEHGGQSWAFSSVPLTPSFKQEKLPMSFGEGKHLQMVLRWLVEVLGHFGH